MTDDHIPFVALLRDEVRRTASHSQSHQPAVQRSLSISTTAALSRRIVGQRPHRTKMPRRVLSATGAVIVAAVIGLVALFGATATTPAAWAVTRSADGRIKLSIHEVSSLSAVNTKLEQDGVRARIVPFRKNCPTGLSLSKRNLRPQTQPWSNAGSPWPAPVGSWTVSIIPSRIPAGRTLVFALREWEHKGWQMVAGYKTGHLPSCASISGNGLTILSR